MALAHDNDGFLTGEPVKIDRSGFARAIEIWHDIKGDTAAIRASLSKRSSDATKATNAQRAGPVAQTPKRAQSAITAQQIERISSGVSKAAEKSRAQAERVATPAASVRSEVVKQQAAMARKAITPERGADGKFKGGNKGGDGKGDDESKAGPMSRAADTMGSAADKISQFADGTEQLDPAIAAAKEVGSVVAPIAAGVAGVGKGVFGLFKKDKEDKALPWYKKIWKELRGINGKKETAKGGGLFGMLGGLMGGAGGFLASLFAPLLTIGARILPLLGTVLLRVFAPIAGVIAAWNVGQWIGEKIHNWLVESGIQGKIFDAFDAAGAFISETWGKVTAKFDAVVKSIGSTWDAIATFLKDKFNILVSLPQQAVEKGREVVRRGVNALSSESKGLTKGRFNEAEQKAILAARQNGEKFNGGRTGIDKATEATIRAAAAKHGVDPEAMLSMARIESGGNANAVSPTGASGLFQFTSGTAKQYGIKNRFDAAENADAAARMMLDNKRALEKAGIDATPENLYLAHQQGAGGAAQILNAAAGKGSISPQVAKNMGLNYGNMKAADYLDKNRRRFVAASVSPGGVSYSNVAPASAMPKSTPTISAAPNVAQLTPPPAPQQPPQQIGSNSKNVGSQNVTIRQEVGQNVSDRGIAQVVTGGIGGYVTRG